MYYEFQTSRASAEALLDYLYESRMNGLKSLYLHKGEEQNSLKIVHNSFVEDTYIYNTFLSAVSRSAYLHPEYVEFDLTYMDLDLYKAKLESYIYRLENTIADMNHMGLDVFQKDVAKGHIQSIISDLNNVEEVKGVSIEDFELNH